MMDRRIFLKMLSAAGLASGLSPASETVYAFVAPAGPKTPYHPGRIENDFSTFLPGEREALAAAPAVRGLREGGRNVQAILGSRTLNMVAGDTLEGWKLVVLSVMSGVMTAVFEKRVSHRGAIAYVTEQGGTIALIPTGIGEISNVRPRPVNTPHGIRLSRAQVPGPDVAGDYILNSEEDPCYENVAAMGPEFTGWSLVANEESSPQYCVYLEPDGRSRQRVKTAQSDWAPDLDGALFEPEHFLPFVDPGMYTYEPGWSKRTLLGGYLPVADTAVWNPIHKAGYQVTMLLPPGKDASPMARILVHAPPAGTANYQDYDIAKDGASNYEEQYWQCSAAQFFENLLGIWNHWSHFYEDTMPVKIPDPWLLEAARAGITLSRCSYQGLEPTYQIGEGAYTKIPPRSHALFPVAHYEYIWAHQLWNLAGESDPYFQYYLDHYILPDGNFLYNTQDQVEGPMNVGYFLMNSARGYWYTGQSAAFLQRLPVLERMLGYVLARYEYGKQHYPRPDRRYGLIWGSPEADLGSPGNDTPTSHPFYYQNSVCIWRGLHEHARALNRIAAEQDNSALKSLAARYTALAEEMRDNIRVSLAATIAAGNSAMRGAGITPFDPEDTQRKPELLLSYENHRFMNDWFLADWGDSALDLGHLKHRILAGLQIAGLFTDGDMPWTSNFMAHGTLAVKIRQEDYRSFLLTLYALVCYTADPGNRYAPEDTYIPGGFAGEGTPWGWSAVVNSALQPALGLRWLLCYEESDQELCHLQKAAPKHWFTPGERIAVRNCPTRWGAISWSTEATGDHAWKVTVEVASGFAASLAVHIHPPDGNPLRGSSAGKIAGNRIMFEPAQFANLRQLEFTVS
jgi:hypothetical protein